MISDPVGLNGASKAQVRQHFKNWCAGRSEERDGPGATKNRTKHLPRFKHCLSVDRKCLNTLAKMPANDLETRGEDYESNVVVVVIDVRFDEGTPHSDDELHPDVEGCTELYVGWRYEEIDQVVETYHDSHRYYSLDGIDYTRPPLIAPNGFDSMST